MQETVFKSLNSTFDNCKASIGSLIYSLNTINPIFFKNSSIKNNQAFKKGIFFNTNSIVKIEILNSNNNKGNFFIGDNTSFIITLINIINHKCNLVEKYGCFISLDNCLITINTAKLTYFNTEIDKSFAILYGGKSFFINIVINFIKNSLSVFHINENNFSFNNVNSTYFEGNFILTYFSTVNCLNINVKNGKNRFFKCSNCLNVSLNNLIINNLIMEKGAIFLENGCIENCIFFVKNSIFSNNYAKIAGGAIYIYNMNFSIKMNKFINNTADKGGAIYLNSTRNYNLIIEKNIFEKNKALIVGGGFFWNFCKPLEKDNIFLKNLAISGPDKSNNPVKIIMKNYNFKQNFISGKKIKNDLIFYIADAYNQIATYIDTGSGEINILNNLNNDKNHLILGNKFSEVKAGFIIFKDLVIISTPDENCNFLVKTNHISCIFI